MVTKKLTLTMDPNTPIATRNLENVVGNFIMEWHYEDCLQEVLNMALIANNIPANVIKVGGPPDTIAFYIQPFPGVNKQPGKKLAKGFRS